MLSHLFPEAAYAFYQITRAKYKKKSREQELFLLFPSKYPNPLSASCFLSGPAAHSPGSSFEHFSPTAILFLLSFPEYKFLVTLSHITLITLKDFCKVLMFADKRMNGNFLKTSHCTPKNRGKMPKCL